MVVDSGSDVTVIRGEEFAARLDKTSARLKSVTDEELKVRGTAVVDLDIGGDVEKCQVFVVNGLDTGILGVDVMKNRQYDQSHRSAQDCRRVLEQLQNPLRGR